MTTEVVGNCGLILAPVNQKTIDQLKSYVSLSIFEGVNPTWEWKSMGDILDFVDNQGNSTNSAMLVGHGTVCIAVMGFDDREPSFDELEEMKKLVAESIEQQALGL